MSNMPSFEQRLKEISFNKAFEDKWKEWKKLFGNDNDSMDVYMKTIRWLRTEEGKVYLEEVKKDTQKKLSPSIPKEWLSMRFSAIYQIKNEQ